MRRPAQPVNKESIYYFFALDKYNFQRLFCEKCRESLWLSRHGYGMVSVVAHQSCQQQHRQQPQQQKAQEIQGRQSGKGPHGGEIIRQQQARQPAQPRQHRSVPDGTPHPAAADNRFGKGHQPVPVDDGVGPATALRQLRHGLSWRLIGIAVVLIAAFIPILWFFLMHDYQRQRVMMLLDPETDPLGAGYHIIQSKIAIGSGGLRGKGWLHGTQSQLEFLPERHTDFIFAVLAEELGLVGILILLALYVLLIMRGLWIAARAQTTFGRVMAGGLMLILFVYVFVNIGMVSGILPVVGVPLPLVSYGGSALIVLMAGFGIVMSIHTHRKMLSKSV